jgi:hypothetical protein
MRLLFQDLLSRLNPRKVLARSRRVADPAAPSGETFPLPKLLESRLAAVIRRATMLGAFEGVLILATLLTLTVAGLCLIDWILDLPRGVRLLNFILLLMAFGWGVFSLIIVPLRVRLNREQAALASQKAMPNLGSSLISSIQLASGKGTHGSTVMVQALIRQTDERIRNLNLAAAVFPLHLFKAWLKLAVLVVIPFLAAAIFLPSVSILLQRLAVANIPLPTLTRVFPVTENLVAPVGSSVLLVAEAEGVIPAVGRVEIIHASGERQSFPALPDPANPKRFSTNLPNVQQSFSYYFQLNDGRSSEFKTLVQLPPTLESLEILHQYPPHTGRKAETLAPGNLVFLAGSTVRIRARSTQPLRSAVLNLHGQEKILEPTLSMDRREVEVSFTVPTEKLTALTVSLVNSEGLGSIDDTVYPIRLIQDQAPEVELIQPRETFRTATLRAKHPIHFRATDDYGLKDVSLVYTVGTSSEEEEGEEFRQTFPIGEDPLRLEERFEWDLQAGKVPVLEGSTVNYWIEATDNNDATGPGVTRTPSRQIRVVTQQEKLAEIFDRIEGKTRDIDEISDRQEKVRKEVGDLIKE